MQWYPLCLFQSHAAVCGSPPTEERDVIQTLNSSHERTVQLTQPVSLFKHLLILLFNVGCHYRSNGFMQIPSSPSLFRGGRNELTTDTAHARVGTVVHTQLV